VAAAGAAAVAVLVFSTVLWLLASATMAHGASVTSPARWLAPCSGGNDVSDDVTGTTPPSTTAAASVDELASSLRKISVMSVRDVGRKISVKMKRLKSRVHQLKNIYVRRRTAS